MLGKEPQAVSKEERNSAKAISFGRPGGMSVGGLRKVAKASYGIFRPSCQSISNCPVAHWFAT